MANLTIVLRDEILRIARKGIRAELVAVKKTSAYQRRTVAKFKRQIAVLERRIALLEKQVHRSTSIPPSESKTVDGFRFSPARLKAQRKKLGLSAADYALLIDVSPLSIYNWEQKKTKPRQSKIAAMATIQSLGKREAKQRVKTISKKSR